MLPVPKVTLTRHQPVSAARTLLALTRLCWSLSTARAPSEVALCVSTLKRRRLLPRPAGGAGHGLARLLQGPCSIPGRRRGHPRLSDMPFVICPLENITREWRWRSLQEGLTLTAERVPGRIGHHCCIMSPKALLLKRTTLCSVSVGLELPTGPFSPPCPHGCVGGPARVSPDARLPSCTVRGRACCCALSCGCQSQCPWDKGPLRLHRPGAAFSELCRVGPPGRGPLGF